MEGFSVSSNGLSRKDIRSDKRGPRHGSGEEAPWVPDGTKHSDSRRTGLEKVFRTSFRLERLISNQRAYPHLVKS